VTKAKYSISRLSEVEKENVNVRIDPINFSACEKKKTKFTINNNNNNNNNIIIIIINNTSLQSRVSVTS
jgi:hypothetical protein